MIREIIGMAFVLLGMFVVGVSLLGVYRFRFVMNRMHAAAISDTLGIFLSVIGFAILSANLFLILKFGLVVLFLWLTSPVTSHMIAKVEMLTNEHFEERVRGK